MLKTILVLGMALSLMGSARADEELAVTTNQQYYLNNSTQSTLVGPSVNSLKADLQAEGLVGTFSQDPVELQATQPSQQLVNDDFIIRPRPQRLEELLPNLPDRSRPYILEPNNHFDLVQFSLY